MSALTVGSPVVVSEAWAAVVRDWTVRQVAVAVVGWSACDHWRTILKQRRQNSKLKLHRYQLHSYKCWPTMKVEPELKFTWTFSSDGVRMLKMCMLPAGAPRYWQPAALCSWLLSCSVQAPSCCFWLTPVAGPWRLSWPGADGGGVRGCTDGCCGLQDHREPAPARWGSGCGP